MKLCICDAGVHKRGVDLSQVLASASARGFCIHQGVALLGLSCVLLPGSFIDCLLIRSVGGGMDSMCGCKLLLGAVTASLKLRVTSQDAGAPKIFTRENTVRAQRYYIALLLTSFAVGLLIVFKTNSSYAR